MNDQVIAAFNEVRKYHPEVVQVFISKLGLWLFFDEQLSAPAFHDDVDVSCLEAMVDSIDILPAAFDYEATNGTR